MNLINLLDKGRRTLHLTPTMAAGGSKKQDVDEKVAALKNAFKDLVTTMTQVAGETAKEMSDKVAAKKDELNAKLLAMTEELKNSDVDTKVRNSLNQKADEIQKKLQEQKEAISDALKEQINKYCNDVQEALKKSDSKK